MRKIERQEKDIQRFENQSLDTYEMWKLQIKERKELFTKVHDRDIVNNFVEEQSQAMDPVEGTSLLISYLLLLKMSFFLSLIRLFVKYLTVLVELLCLY